MTGKIFACLFVLLLALPAQATLTTDPAKPITHRVNVHATIVSDDAGANAATGFGNLSQQNVILAGIDQIWAQAGIDIQFTFTATTWKNTFALSGTAGAATRPTADLTSILNLASSSGLLDPNPIVLNLFFVSTVPGFTPQSANNVSGFARVAGNGIAIYVGSNLLTFTNGLDGIAGVVGHEIGHNLGLAHAATGGDNLMSPSGTAEFLTSAQITSVLSSSFVVAIPEPSSLLLCLFAAALLLGLRRTRPRLPAC